LLGLAATELLAVTSLTRTIQSDDPRGYRCPGGSRRGTTGEEVALGFVPFVVDTIERRADVVERMKGRR
jgi:hypothetical protein